MTFTTLRFHRRAELIRVCLLITVALLLPSRAHGQTRGGCMLPDPFVALGGGTCFNGGWLPPGMAVPPSPPPASSSDCLTPDPFIALGGGTCFNGGWLPPGMAVPPSPSPASSSGCLTPDPFIALGGGTCINGGWFPPGADEVPTLPTSPALGGCTTPDPFAFIPGMSGVCVDGGWQPTGTPTAAIHFTGVVFETTSAGQVPVAGASVTIDDINGDPVLQTTTDANGRFSITVADASSFANSPFSPVYVVSMGGFDDVVNTLDLDFSSSLLANIDVNVELVRGGVQ